MTPRPARAARALAVLNDRVDGDAHQPSRPGWDCMGCGQDWPCAPAKVRLGEAYGSDRVGLRVYMAGLYEQALDELLMWPAADVFTRFVLWARPTASR
ncbi:hypothetical protein [Micromonospora endolithica]|uniref:Flavin reductase n=1 Tax=Micromonospora endolithica TaxID=230091 RepID=A0A3A9YT58_9ACTN|nr:hypothetical protein [Micromonospora endolithica]RKN38436.1 hypothetical protein D7223_31005 [Micromonospora endolithica]TWJ23145.1 hypothetical protein JD76_03274 [Micromonospora endolithica]